MKKYLLFMVCASLLGTAAAVWAADTHPVEMEGKDCLYCHDEKSVSETKSESPAGKQWAKSMHGLNNVGCFTCHGDESNFRAASSMDNCISCHSGEAAVIKRKTKEQEGRIICVNCHAAHDFAVKKEKKNVHAK